MDEKKEIIDINNVIDVPAVQTPEKREETTIATKEHISALLGFVKDQRDCYALAKTWCTADTIPAAYQNKPANVAIAIDMSVRMGVSPMMVMQNLKPIKGNPTWSGQACMSFIRNRYSKVKPVYTGTKGTDSRGCYITAVDDDGDKLEGTEVTIAMAKADGWYGRNPKWQSMPEQMLVYRAAAFFARVYCPDVLMGCPVEGEAEDIEKPSKRKVEDVL